MSVRQADRNRSQPWKLHAYQIAAAVRLRDPVLKNTARRWDLTVWMEMPSSAAMALFPIPMATRARMSSSLAVSLATLDLESCPLTIASRLTRTTFALCLDAATDQSGSCDAVAERDAAAQRGAPSTWSAYRTPRVNRASPMATGNRTVRDFARAHGRWPSAMLGTCRTDDDRTAFRLFSTGLGPSSAPEERPIRRPRARTYGAPGEGTAIPICGVLTGLVKEFPAAV